MASIGSKNILEKWETTRKIGFFKYFATKFLTLLGILVAGLIIRTIAGYGKETDTKYFIIFPAVCFLMVLVSWFWNEFRYKRHNK